MTQETLNLIHRIYQESVKSSSNILEILENLYQKLSDIDDVPEEDSMAFDAFIDGIRGSLKNRQKTFEITNMATFLTITMMFIVLWLNNKRNMHIDINWYARRKSLESELTKLLSKSNDTLSCKIRDRFGIRGIVLNDNISDKQKNIIIYSIFNSICGIIAAKNRKDKKEFCEWVSTNPIIDSVSKVMIEKTLKTPFSIDFVKDYIINPKTNGYQSLQFTIGIPFYSNTLPGCQIEIQLRTKKMHDIATFGSASHLQYKQTGGIPEEELTENNKAIKKVFVVDDFSKIHIVGFTSYDSKEDDRDGIHFPKEFFNRRISTTLLSK